MSAKIEVLGAYGGRFRHKNTTTFAVSESILIDAGNIVGALGKEARAIRHIFLTHAHLDHILDIPFLADTLFSEIRDSIRIYALPETIDSLKTHVMNDLLWPDFSRINLPGTDAPCIVYVPLECGKNYEIDGYTLTPIPVEHTVPACGYVVAYEDAALYISGDTALCDTLWKTVNDDARITTLLLEVSFPSELGHVAEVSKHLTPKLAQEVLKRIEREDVHVCFYHMKPFYRDTIKYELDELLEGHIEYTVLDDQDTVDFERRHK